MSIDYIHVEECKYSERAVNFIIHVWLFVVPPHPCSNPKTSKLSKFSDILNSLTAAAAGGSLNSVADPTNCFLWAEKYTQATQFAG